MNTLKNYYIQGLIPYLRVENGYIKESLFSYFPHPELPIINEYFEPLKSLKYEVNQHTLLLHFHNKRYFNVSQVQQVQGLIAKNYKSKDIKQSQKLIENYRDFLEIKQKDDFDYFLKEQLEHYKINKPKLKEINYNIQSNFIEYIDSLNVNSENFFENTETLKAKQEKINTI